MAVIASILQQRHDSALIARDRTPPARFDLAFRNQNASVPTSALPQLAMRAYNRDFLIKIREIIVIS
ncbi:hypothetical protein [Allorhizobium undicola]|uniref:hypothetical protein n=1 Tax=Allorhizobium undicola TaxID=78527 RepID=UPI00056A12CD|nr:hypothetical protein [Allorhizobium undicola]